MNIKVYRDSFDVRRDDLLDQLSTGRRVDKILKTFYGYVAEVEDNGNDGVLIFIPDVDIKDVLPHELKKKGKK